MLTSVHTSGYTGDALVRFAGFDWDPGNRAKCERHGLSISEIEELFKGPLSVYPDVAHSVAEARFHAIGRTAAGRHAFAVFTLRRRNEETWIRVISARYMHAKEIRHYKTSQAAHAPQR